IQPIKPIFCKSSLSISFVYSSFDCRQLSILGKPHSPHAAKMITSLNDKNRWMMIAVMLIRVH
ncbi:hypothetical protein M5D96_012753, partial [Drosophila gunungcola]